MNLVEAVGQVGSPSQFVPGIIIKSAWACEMINILTEFKKLKFSVASLFQLLNNKGFFFSEGSTSLGTEPQWTRTSQDSGEENITYVVPQSHSKVSFSHWAVLPHWQVIGSIWPHRRSTRKCPCRVSVLEHLSQRSAWSKEWEMLLVELCPAKL